MRLFAAIPLPEQARDDLARLFNGLPGARWTPRENLHLTLRFFGEVDGATAEDLVDALATVPVPEFELQLDRFGHFETARKPHTLWIAPARDAALMQLHGSVDAAARRVGLPPDRRRYTPHVTLARLRDTPAPSLHKWFGQHALDRPSPFSVFGFSLFSSFLARSGAIHREEARYGACVSDEWDEALEPGWA